MIYTLLNVIYVLVAISIIALILLQRGAGAAAGSGFGAGASATVFGARGASNFLSKSTAVLSAIFFAMSLGMAIYLHKSNSNSISDDLGVMGGVPAASVPAEIPTGEVPAATPATETVVPVIDETAPVETSTEAPAESKPEAAPAQTPEPEKK